MTAANNHTNYPDNISENSYSLLFKFGTLIWLLMVVLNGTYLRDRPQGLEVATADWLIYARLACAGVGFLAGVLLLQGKRPLAHGMGKRISILYVIVAFLSALFSDYLKISMGYSALLAGMVILTIGLLENVRTISTLGKLETLLTVVILGCILNDATISFLSPEMQLESQQGYIDIRRLGMGVSHPNSLSFLAVFVFWSSFMYTTKNLQGFLWLLRFVLLAILIFAKSRVSIICFFCVFIVRLIMKADKTKAKGIVLKYAYISSFTALFSLFLLLAVFEAPFITSALESFNRGESISRIKTFTGRTEIWTVVISQFTDNPITTLFGNGYGVSELVLNDKLSTSLTFRPSHTHNTFLEFMLTMGLAGIMVLIAMTLYSINYFILFRKFYKIEIVNNMLLNGSLLLTMLYVSSLMETYIARKINPIMIAFIFYLVLLDRIVYLTADSRRH